MVIVVNELCGNKRYGGSGEWLEGVGGLGLG